MGNVINQLVGFIQNHDGINDKVKLTHLVSNAFSLTKDRSVCYCDEFAIRFSKSATQNFGNTVLSLSKLHKFDDRPFIVCVVTPLYNYTFLANSTFLKKISHSSQEFRENNIRGSFNGSDVMREFEGVPNHPDNFEWLFNIHVGLGFDGNLVRLVEATNDIVPTGKKFVPNDTQRQQIRSAPARAIKFACSGDAKTLKANLDTKVSKFRNEIIIAGLIENVNVRGRIIEYLIAGEDEDLRQKIIAALQNKTGSIPEFKTDNALGDYSKTFADYNTQTDIKTKIMVLDSNPKAYNLDKILEFLSTERSVFMFYFIGIDPDKIVNTVLISMFQKDLLDSTILLKHWAGRNSRGVSQFVGKTIGKLILFPDQTINEKEARQFLEQLLEL